MIMINLFSVFDPCSYFGLSLNWVIILFIFIFYINRNYKLNRGYKIFINRFLVNVGSVFKEIADLKYLAIVFLRVLRFVYLIRANLIGLFPFIFRFTAHIYITLGIGLVL